MNDKLKTLGIVFCIVSVVVLALWNGLRVGGLQAQIETLQEEKLAAGEGWWQSMATLKLALERIDRLEMELANEELFSEHVQDALVDTRFDYAELKLALAYEQRRIPVCQEDAVIVPAPGAQFETVEGVPGGQWESYACGLSWDDYK